jgi:predicted permease
MRHALRFLLRRPLFAGVAVLSLAVGLGASTTVFSVANALLWRPPSGVAGADRVVELGRTTGGRGFDTFSYPELQALQRAGALTAVAGWTWRPLSLSTGGAGERVLSMLVSHTYFDVMGLAPQRGRFFGPEEDAVPGGGPVVVLSHRFWRDRMGGDAAVIGRSIELNRRSFTVIGIMPEAFRGHAVAGAPDLYIPLTMMGVAVPGFDAFTERWSSWLTAVGRLAPGATLAQARASLNATLGQLEQRNDDERNARGVAALALGPVPGFGRTAVTAFLGMLLAAVGLVLLTTCANVAGMLIARATAREREIAIRLALGASRRRLIQQLLVESLVLFLLGGAGGVLLALWGTDLLSAVQLPVPVTLAFDFRPDLRVLGFGLLLALATGTVFGLAPALQASSPAVIGSLKNDSARRGSRGGRLRRGFVAAQIGLSLILLISSGLFLRSLQRAAGVHTGFDARGTWMLTLDLAIDGYDEARGRGFVADLTGRLRALPAVEGAALATDLPLDLSKSESPAYPEGYPLQDGRPGALQSANNTVSDGYFRALGIEIVRGRDFTANDRAGTLPVAIISRNFAQAAWPDQDALGRRLRWGSADGEWLTVVGVVDDVKNQMLSEAPEPMIYLPIAQQYVPALTVVLKRAAGAGVANAAVDAIHQLDPRLSLTQPQSIEDYTAVGLLPQRMAAAITTALGLLALLLSAIGVYGIVAWTVAQRTREIGVRMALGARRADVLGMVLRGGLRLALPGLGAGLLAAFALSRLLRGFILGVAPGDPITFLAMPAVLLGAIVLAALGPARRASGIAPMQALRSE